MGGEPSLDFATLAEMMNIARRHPLAPADLTHGPMVTSGDAGQT